MGQEKLKFYAIAILLFITLAFCLFFTNGTSPSPLADFMDFQNTRTTQIFLYSSHDNEHDGT